MSGTLWVTCEHVGSPMIVDYVERAGLIRAMRLEPIVRDQMHPVTRKPRVWRTSIRYRKPVHSSRSATRRSEGERAASRATLRSARRTGNTASRSARRRTRRFRAATRRFTGTRRPGCALAAVRPATTPLRSLFPRGPHRPPRSLRQLVGELLAVAPTTGSKRVLTFNRTNS